MKVLSVKEDVISIQLKSGEIILVKEQDIVILKGKYMNKCKVGVDDAQIMGLALKNVFAEELEELKQLREIQQKVVYMSTSTYSGSYDNTIPT
jgi:hypothetical protein